MASILSAGTTTATGLNLSADTTGVLQLASNNGTVGLTMDTSQNVGIGTSSPGYKLHVANSSATSTTLLANILARLQSNASGADASLQFSDNVANSAGISLNQGALVFSIAGGSVGRFDTSGNLGIGTSSPNQKLQVNNTAVASSFALFTNATTGSTGSDGTYFGIDSSGNTYVWNQENTAMLFGTNNGERMRIDSSGNVGIGTSSPQSSLQVAGALGSAPTGAGVHMGITSLFASIQLNGDASTGSIIDFSTSGTDYLGRILYNNASNFLSFSTNNAERMRIDSSGNLGIGTTSPNAKLDLLTTASTRMLFTERGTGGNVIDSVNGTNTAYSQFLLNGSTLIFATGATERARIDSSGNVGIGTSSPAGLAQKTLTAQVTGTSSVAITAGDYSSGAGSTNTMIESLGQRYDGNTTFGGRIGAAYRRSDGTAISSNTSLGYYLFGGQWGTDTSFQQAKLLYSASIVGVAESSFTSASTMSTAIVFNTGSTGNASSTANVTYGTERMRIDSSGKLLVGLQTAATGGLVQFRNASAPALSTSVSGTSVQSTPAIQVSKPDATNTTSQIFTQFYVSDYSTGSWQINANGASAVAFGSFSDKRLKENIVDLPSQLDKIMALRPVEFDYVESMGGGHQIGFIAQEVQTVYPDLVGVGENEMLTLTDMNKNDARLIKAIQEQQALITQLQADVAALKGAA